MNILVMHSDGSYSVRPDSTLIREPKDFFLPDGCDGVEVHSCRWTRANKAGKAVGARFAGRYFDSLGTGLLIYCHGTDGSLSPFVDRTTFFTLEMTPADDEPATAQAIADAIVVITRLTSLRTGDIVVVEDSAAERYTRGDVITFQASASSRFELSIR